MNPLLKTVFFVLYAISLYLLVYWFLLYLDTRHRMKKEKALSHPPKRFPHVTVLVPAHNEAKTIEKTLTSLALLNYPHDKFNIVVLNNASTDDTEHIVRAFIKRHQHLAITQKVIEKPGKAHALNLALKEVTAPFFVCLDADSYVHKDAMREMVAKFERAHKDLTILTPVMKIKHPETLIQRVQRIEYIFAALMAKLMSYVDANYVAPGPFSMYKTEIIKRLGAFDEHSLVEDQEIAYKVQKHHLKIAQCSTAFVYTIGPQNVKGLRRQRNRWIKGTILTAVDYRSIMFNRQYGDFGLFQIPLIFTHYVLALFSLFVAFYYILKPLYKGIRNLILVRFDIIPYLKTFRFEFDVWNIDFMFSFLLGVLFLTSLFFLAVASRSTEDHLLKKHGFFPLVMYYYVYFLLLGTVLIEVIIDFFSGRKQRW